ncbi:MAG: PD-(D/E)XK nuclease family protein [Rikenellaceae bacterium]
MRSFLAEVAQDLYAHYGAEVGELNMLFPSRRARLFFTEALSSLTDRPIWEPRWVSIDEVMSSVAGLEVGERVRLVAELYKIYVKYHKTERFDHFYGWGEVLIADFDMVDKYMIDAEDLFRNVSDIKELESDISYLDERQLRIIAFWSSIESGKRLSEQKRKFLEVWRSLAPIYREFRERLLELGFAYSGMVHRIAAERMSSGDYEIDPNSRYVVAGFNALSECEKRLFKALQSGAKTRFYWDWDDYYSESAKQEAGLFLATNRRLFPSAAEISHDNFARAKQMSVVASSSSALQCKYVAEVLAEIVAGGGVIDKRTAIVLTDESLLMPLLYALPSYVGRVNVTMGYPLRQSLAYSFAERLLALQSHARHSVSRGEAIFYHVDVVGLLSHPYLEAGVEAATLRRIERRIRSERLISVSQSELVECDLLQMIFRRVEGWCALSNYITEVIDAIVKLPHTTESDGEQRVEFLSFIADQIATLHNSVERCEIELTTSTYVSLLRRHIQPLRIPFEGEPLEGLQVMGILETRNLDFENVIILSMNDDNFPGNRTQQPSYIPYTLRFAFDLPTPEHHDGVYAYYFYRLIQRAQRVWMLYCSCADDKSTGEQSRYITQLDYESPFELRRLDVGVDVTLADSAPMVVEKKGHVAEQLRRFVGEMGGEQSQLSPTALFQYVACPLRFYFRSLARLKVSEELSEEVDAPMFGTILHDAMQILYGERLQNVTNAAAAIALIKRRDVEVAVESAIKSNYLRLSDDAAEPVELSGNLLVVREVVTKYIVGGVLKYDAAHPNFQVEGNEMEILHYLPLSNGGYIRLRGICDRIDTLSNGNVRVVDYKTGAEHLEFAGLDALFGGEGKQRQSNIFQTLLYSFMMREGRYKGRRITPALYYVRRMNQDDYDPSLVCVEGEKRTKTKSPIECYEDYHAEFESHLLQTIEEIFNPDIPFTQCEDQETTCAYCDFQKICRREVE